VARSSSFHTALPGAFIIDALTREPTVESATARTVNVWLALVQILCAASLALAVVILQPTTLAGLSPELKGLAEWLAGGYVACAALFLLLEYRGSPIRVDTLISALVVCFFPALIFSWHTHGVVPTRVIFPELVAAGALATISFVLRRLPKVRLALLAVLGLVGLALPFAGLNKPEVLPSVRHWRLNSSLYGFKVTEYRTLIGASEASGGAVSVFRDRYVVANGQGDVYLVSRSATTHELSAVAFKSPVPINRKDFVATFGKVEDVGYFRTADLLAQDLGDHVRLFATHHFWKTDQKCFVVRLSMLELPVNSLLQGGTGEPWRTIFESTPCVRLNTEGPLAHFGGIQIGGRLALLSPHELLVAVGDHEHDGVNSADVFPQDATNSYGKTILIDLADFSSQIYSIGHRNPQGLYADDASTIWLTEHGPQGGDEVNLVHRGANYGWPLATYGTQYGAHFWPGSPVAGSHEGYAQPFYSFVPSIGISSLLVVHGPQYKLWDGDLLIASLKDQAMYRARVRDARIVMMERIPLGRRIRDITQGADGQLIVWTDRGGLLEIELDNDVGSGETVFQACLGCHQIGEGADNGIGPDLRKVVNRPVASVPGFRYSSALSGLGGRWTRERLDKFLAGPKAFLPGTKMQFPGVPNEHDRVALIEFLASGGNNNPPPEDLPN
jgi:cytochrome c2